MAELCFQVVYAILTTQHRNTDKVWQL